jgi:hypothetical protein
VLRHNNISELPIGKKYRAPSFVSRGRDTSKYITTLWKEESGLIYFYSEKVTKYNRKLKYSFKKIVDMFRKRSRIRDSASSNTQDEEIGVETGNLGREAEGDMGDLESMGDIFGPDQTLDPTSYDITRNHPLGKLLLNALSDTTNLAKRTNTKETENNIKDVCDMFCAHLNLTEAS